MSSRVSYCIVVTHTPPSPTPSSLPHSQDDGLMILCGLCKVWQHAVCFALLTEDEVPELHICEQCSSDQEGEGQPCTDPFLQFLSPVALQVCVCVCVHMNSHSLHTSAGWAVVTRTQRVIHRTGHVSDRPFTIAMLGCPIPTSSF